MSKLPKERDAPSRINAHPLSVFESSAFAPELALVLALVLVLLLALGLAPELNSVTNTH